MRQSNKIIMDTVDEIQAKAEELFLQFGVRSVSMDDLASALGRSKKTLYKYFSCKQDLVKKILLAYVEREKTALTLIKKQSENAIDEWYRVFMHHLEFTKSLKVSVQFDLKKYHPKTWEIIKKFKNQFIYQLVLENVKRGKQEALYRQDVNEKAIAMFYVSRIEETVDNDISRKMKLSPGDLFLSFVDYHIYGIASPKGIAIYNELKSKNDAL